MKGHRLAIVFWGIWGIWGMAVGAEEWKPLFDGKSLDGWVQRGGKAEYRVEEGVIVGTAVPGTPNSFLCTEREYGDFILELEFQVDPSLNSGVQIRSQSLADYKEGQVHGYQVEIDPSRRGWSGGIYDEGRRGWLYPLKTRPEARYAFRQDEWNHYRVEAVGSSIRTWINGVAAADLEDDMTVAGFIALQVHGVGKREDRPEVRWREIRIQEVAEGAELVRKDVKEGKKETGAAGPLVKEGAGVRKLADGFRFVEGPAKGPDGRIYFNDIPNERTHVFDLESGEVAVWRENTGKANGLWWTPAGTLLACEGGARRITEQAGDEIRVVVDAFEGKKLNSPNDLVLDEQGGIYFSDPRYGGDGSDRELEKESVYYVSQKGVVSLATEEVTKPNGVILSPDYRVLYVADTAEKRIYAFDVVGEGKLANRREFAPAGSDGFAMDERGNLYATWESGIWIWSPEGEQVGMIECPERPANCVFGGPGDRTLYITARTGFYAVEMNVAGVR